MTTYANDDTTQASAPIRVSSKKPMEPETKAFLIGVIGVVGILGVLLGFWVHTGYTSDNGRSKDNTEQVQACSGIEDALSAYACVVEMNRSRD
jgi:hypothetical protein